MRLNIRMSVGLMRMNMGMSVGSKSILMRIITLITLMFPFILIVDLQNSFVNLLRLLIVILMIVIVAIILLLMTTIMKM